MIEYIDWKIVQRPKTLDGDFFVQIDLRMHKTRIVTVETLVRSQAEADDFVNDFKDIIQCPQKLEDILRLLVNPKYLKELPIDNE